MTDSNAIEQAHSMSSSSGAEMYLSIEVEKNSRSFTTRVKATVRWQNWDASDPNVADSTNSYMVPMGDGQGGAGLYMALPDVLDDLMKRGEAAVANAIARTNSALVAKGEGDDK